MTNTIVDLWNEYMKKSVEASQAYVEYKYLTEEARKAFENHSLAQIKMNDAYRNYMAEREN